MSFRHFPAVGSTRELKAVIAGRFSAYVASPESPHFTSSRNLCFHFRASLFVLTVHHLTGTACESRYRYVLSRIVKLPCTRNCIFAYVGEYYSRAS